MPNKPDKFGIKFWLASDVSKPANEPQPSTSRVNVSCLKTNSAAQVLLATAVVDIVDNRGQLHQCRVLLDSCTQSHFLTQKFVDRAKLKTEKVEIPITGMNRMTSQINHFTTARMKSRTTAFSQDLGFLVVKEIADIVPSMEINEKDLEIPKHVRLADPDFHIPSEIDGLVGAQLFWKLLCIGQIKLASPYMYLQKTIIGWIVVGEIHARQGPPKVRCCVTLNALQEQLSRFWEIEEGPRERLLSAEESECERHYKENTRRDPETGRYTVKLPFKATVQNLGESRTTALKRFEALERSLARNPQYREQYNGFMREYESLGHMTKVQSSPPSEGYYLPHHAVRKETSVTTKT
ncbi:uncharacterized protein LOC122403154 [Colletes gigas]|uniref:uncharacterized protein LOC122403154 n=1 Tax=Colletes gigas TaxID=935657 RepID=UPI001C9BA2DC|nr:uncharacterized protein LOC122403154 [Colletes gigas]